MKTKNLGKVLFYLICVLVGIVFCFAILPWIIAGVGSLLLPSPSKPQITYGEFPFMLVYEERGEKRVIQDTVICEFVGFGVDTASLKYRKWERRFASGNSDAILWSQDSSDGGRKKLYYDIPPAWFYMGDLPGDFFDAHTEGFSDIFDYYYVNNYSRVMLEEWHADGSRDGSFIDDEILNSEFGIRIVSWESAPPIENTFL